VCASGAPDLDAPCGLGAGSTTSRETAEAAALRIHRSRQYRYLSTTIDTHRLNIVFLLTS
jgi:hypothetical protein